MKNSRILIQTAKMENKTPNKAKMSNKWYTKARLQYSQRGYKVSEKTSQAPCFALLRFSWLTCLILPSHFFLNNKIHFSLANANNSTSFKRKMVKNHGFCSFTNNKQTCE